MMRVLGRSGKRVVSLSDFVRVGVGSKDFGTGAALFQFSKQIYNSSAWPFRRK
jgi:hypothetical protein